MAYAEKRSPVNDASIHRRIFLGTCRWEGAYRSHYTPGTWSVLRIKHEAVTCSEVPMQSRNHRISDGLSEVFWVEVAFASQCRRGLILQV